MKTYFITGATGAVGSAVVQLLLRDENTLIQPLIRAQSPEQLDARVGDLLGFLGFSPAQQAIRQRIQAISGDIGLPRFGMDDAVYNKLTSECTHIVHCAGRVRMNLPMEEARKAAVDAAGNVIGLAQACQQLDKVEFVSTVGVAGRNVGSVPEDWITNERAFHNTYEASKAEAETYIAKEIAHGLPITVHRPSMVVGNSSSGKIVHFQVFYHLCEFISGRRTRGFLPHFGTACLDTIPVDYVARAIVWSSQQAATRGRILHLCSGPKEAIKIQELQHRVREQFRLADRALPKTHSIPPSLFRAALPLIGVLVPKEVRRAVKTLPIFLDYLADIQYFANDETRTLLEPEGIEVPPVASYLGKVLGYYLRRRPQS